MPNKGYNEVKGICPKRKGGVIMPARDQSGPLGQGSMTGRGFGICNTANTANTPNARFFGRGRGRGRGNGNGIGSYSYPRRNQSNEISVEDEKTMLQNRLNELNEHTKK